MSENNEEKTDATWPKEGYIDLAFGGQMKALFHEDGTVEIVDESPDSGDFKAIHDYLEDRLPRIDGKLAALEAEKAVWLKRIDRQFGVEIKALKGYRAHVVGKYKEIIKQHIQGLFVGTARSTKLGTLMYGVRKTQRKIEVDKDSLLQYLWGTSGGGEDAGLLACAYTDLSESMVKEEIQRRLAEGSYTSTPGIEITESEDELYVR